MGYEYELDCQGTPVTLKIGYWPYIELIGYDPEPDEAAVALGLEPSDCYILWQGILSGHRAKPSLEIALVKAAQLGRAELVDLIWNQVLEQVVAEWYDEFENIYEALEEAAKHGHIPVIRNLLGGHLPFEDGQAEQAVWLAAHHGHQDVLDEFRRWHAGFVPRHKWPQELL
jgi:hypothetical protein